MPLILTEHTWIVHLKISNEKFDHVHILKRRKGENYAYEARNINIIIKMLVLSRSSVDRVEVRGDYLWARKFCEQKLIKNFCLFRET